MLCFVYSFITREQITGLYPGHHDYNKLVFYQIMRPKQALSILLFISKNGIQRRQSYGYTPEETNSHHKQRVSPAQRRRNKRHGRPRVPQVPCVWRRLTVKHCYSYYFAVFRLADLIFLASIRCKLHLMLAKKIKSASLNAAK